MFFEFVNISFFENDTYNFNRTGYPTDSLGTIVPYLYSLTVVLSIIFILGILFNLLSITSILSSKKFTTINVLILNLAFADLTYTMGIPLFLVHIFSKNWPFGVFGCQLFFLTDFIGMIVGVFTVTALSVERFFDVADKKKRFDSFSNKFKLFIILIYLVLIWIFAILFPMPMILSIELFRHSEYAFCGSRWEDKTLNIFFVIKFVVIFLFPYTLITISSTKLLLFLNRWQRSSHNRRFSLITRTNILNSRVNMKKEIILISEPKMSSMMMNNDVKVIVLNSSLQSIESSEQNLFDKQNSTQKVDVKNEDYDEDDRKRKSLLYYVRACAECVSFTFGFDKCSVICGGGGGSTAAGGESFINEVKVHSYTSSIRNKASRLVLIIVLLFFIQWIPLWLFQLFNTFSNGNIKYIQLINIIITVLSYSNSVTNPAIYMFLTCKFKEYFRNGFLNYFFGQSKQQKNNKKEANKRRSEI